MDRAEKAEVISTLTESFKGSGAIVIAHYTGLTVSDLEDLRVQMKQAGGQVKVAKNRLAKLALKQTENADITDLFTGPTVYAFSDDPITAPKIAMKYAKSNDKFIVRGGTMGTTELDVAGVAALAELPSLDELRGQLAGLLTRPASNIAQIVQAPAAQIARVVSAYADEGAAA